MDYALQQLINGLTLGMIYGLIALGYTMVYGIIGMINFAHGDIFMVGAFISLIGFLLIGMGGVTFVPLALILVLVLAMAFTSLYGFTVERCAPRSPEQKGAVENLVGYVKWSFFAPDGLLDLEQDLPRQLLECWWT